LCVHGYANSKTATLEDKVFVLYDEESKVKIVKSWEASEMPNPHGVDARELHSIEPAQVVLVTLQAGQALKRHITPVDVFLYVLEGQGVVEIGQEREEVSADMLIESPARIPHRLINNGDGVFRILVVKTPRPTEATKIL
jgi:quercetin dioxygenase-like cupin family protein